MIWFIIGADELSRNGTDNGQCYNDMAKIGLCLIAIFICGWLFVTGYKKIKNVL